MHEYIIDHPVNKIIEVECFMVWCALLTNDMRKFETLQTDG